MVYRIFVLVGKVAAVDLKVATDLFAEDAEGDELPGSVVYRLISEGPT